jgi:hydrogenase nickel incorporation protein HypA/HybF
MHELALTQAIVEICAERAGGSRVLRVRVEVGSLACVMPEALRFCFEVVASGTILEGAALEILTCEGQELRVKDMEVL